jgi:hypothetical protein
MMEEEEEEESDPCWEYRENPEEYRKCQERLNGGGNDDER